MDYSVEENASNVVEQDNAQVVNAPDADGEAQEEVSLQEFLPQQEETAVDTGDGDQLPNVTNQKDFNKALRERLSKESDKGYNRGRQEVENSAEMQFVRQLIEERAKEKNITTQQALEDLQNERINRQADYYAKNPSAWFAEQMRSQQQVQQPINTGLSSDAFVQQMADAIRNNQIPQGFDVRNPPTEFLQDANEFGVPAALRMYTLRNAEQIQQQANAQQIADELAKRQRGSKPMSPSSANPNITREFDFNSMSSAEFAELDKKLMKAALEGKIIR